MKSEYKAMADEDKVQWVRKCVREVSNQSSDHQIESFSFLSKDELRLMQGAPTKPTPNAYNLFVRHYCSDRNHKFNTAAEAYRNLTAEEKQKFQDEADVLRLAAEVKMEKAAKERQSSEQLDTSTKSTKSSVVKAPAVKEKTKKKAKDLPPPIDDEVIFKSPTKPAPHALDESSSSLNGSHSKKRKLSRSRSPTDIAMKIKKEKVRPVEPERVPT